MLFTGDAAGLVDPLTAEGISHAILSGKLAAEAIVNGEFVERQVTRLYNKTVEQQILSELRIARQLAKLLYQYPHLRQPLMSRFGQTFCESVANIITGKRSYRQLLLNPGKHLKLLMMPKRTVA